MVPGGYCRLPEGYDWWRVASNDFAPGPTLRRRIGMDADQEATVLATSTCCSSDLTSLRTAATREITEHLNDDGLCAICGSAWPCERVVLAEHNLALL